MPIIRRQSSTARQLQESIQRAKNVNKRFSKESHRLFKYIIEHPFVVNRVRGQYLYSPRSSFSKWGKRDYRRCKNSHLKQLKYNRVHIPLWRTRELKQLFRGELTDHKLTIITYYQRRSESRVGLQRVYDHKYHPYHK